MRPRYKILDNVPRKEEGAGCNVGIQVECWCGDNVRFFRVSDLRKTRGAPGTPVRLHAGAKWRGWPCCLKAIETSSPPPAAVETTSPPAAAVASAADRSGSAATAPAEVASARRTPSADDGPAAGGDTEQRPSDRAERMLGLSRRGRAAEQPDAATGEVFVTSSSSSSSNDGEAATAAAAAKKKPRRSSGGGDGGGGLTRPRDDGSGSSNGKAPTRRPRSGCRAATEVRRVSDGPDAPWVSFATRTEAAAMVGTALGPICKHLNQSGGSKRVPGVDPINGWLCRSARDGAGGKRESRAGDDGGDSSDSGDGGNSSDCDGDGNSSDSDADDDGGGASSDANEMSAVESDESDEDNEDVRAEEPARIIEQLDASTGKVLGRWPSAPAASRGLGISSSSVGNVLRGTSRTAGGFKWRVAIVRKVDAEDSESAQEAASGEEQQDEDEAAQPKRMVEQLNADTDEVLSRWPSISAAGRGVGLSDNGVGHVLCGPQRVAGGFRWRHGEAAEQQEEHREEDANDDGDGAGSSSSPTGANDKATEMSAVESVVAVGSTAMSASAHATSASTATSVSNATSASARATSAPAAMSTSKMADTRPHRLVRGVLTRTLSLPAGAVGSALSSSSAAAAPAATDSFTAAATARDIVDALAEACPNPAAYTTK